MLRTTFALTLLLACAVQAQDRTPDRAAEVKELEAMLARVDAALAALEPLHAPAVTLEQYDVRHLAYRPADRIAPSLWVPSQSAGYRTASGAGSALAVSPVYSPTSRSLSAAASDGSSNGAGSPDG